MEHRMGFEPMNTGFADQRVSHFAIGASRCQLVLPACHGVLYGPAPSSSLTKEQARQSSHAIDSKRRGRNYFGCAAVRIYAFTFLKPPG